MQAHAVHSLVGERRLQPQAAECCLHGLLTLFNFCATTHGNCSANCPNGHGCFEEWEDRIMRNCMQQNMS